MRSGIGIHFKIALVAMMLNFSLPLARAEQACPSLYRRALNRVTGLVRGSQLSLLDQIQSRIRGFAWGAGTLGKDKLFVPSAEAHSLLLRLNELGPDERSRYLQSLQNLSVKGSERQTLRGLALLALGDEANWMKAVSGIGDVSLLSSAAYKYLDVFAQKMPASLRERLLRKIGENYWELDKYPKPDVALGPKRVADLYIKNLLRADRMISDEIRSGRSASRAYAKYVKQVQSYIHLEDPYSGEEVLNALRDIQSQLKEHVRRYDVTPFKGGAEPELYIGGSFPNGRADLTHSDLDFTSNFNVPSFLVDGISLSFRNRFVGRLGADGLKATYASMVSKEFFLERQPIVFRIRKDRIEMLVGSRTREVQAIPIE